MHVRVTFDGEHLRQLGCRPITTFSGGGTMYRSEEIAQWHGAAITMLSEALKGDLDTVTRVQIADQIDGHERAQMLWASAMGEEAVKASDAVLRRVGAGLTLAQAVEQSGPGWPGRPRALRYPPTYTAAAKAALEAR